MNQPLSGAEGNRSYRLDEVNRAGGAASALVLVSFSGGGKRSAAFGHGVLRGMREIEVVLAGGRPSRLLDEVDQVAGVSGGSFPAAHFALYGDRSFETFPAEFLNVDINAYIFGTFLLPWNWQWMFNPAYGTNDRMASIYDELMFRGATFADLARRGRPQVSINATDISFGVPFAFTPSTFDLLCSDLYSYPVARAVAASNGFPVLFTPITLQSHREGCRVPAPNRPDRAAARADLRTRQLGETIDRYLDPQRTQWVHLMDGGIADNLALRGTLNTITVLTAQSDLFREDIMPMRRILVISVDGQAAANPNWPRQRLVTGIGQILSAVSGTQIDSFNIETLMLTYESTARLVERAKQVRCARAPMIDGFPCDDVKGLVVRASLSDYQDAAVRERLQAIPTGLTISAADVDALVAAGEATIAEDAAAIRAFLADLPPAAPARVARQR